MSSARSNIAVQQQAEQQGKPGFAGSVSIPERLLALLFALSRHQPRVIVEIWPRAQYTEARLRELHALATRLMVEDFEHFRIHAATNEIVHVFRRADTGDVIGFQFWATAEIPLPRSRILLGGKLRVDPGFRNRGLHLVSGLLFFVQTKLRHPLTRYYRLSIASMFGFVSITEALHEYHVLDLHATSREARAIAEAFRRRAEDSHFVLDERTGLIFVDIFMTPETLARYSPAYFAKPAAQAYAAVNPEFRTNGCFVGFWFRFTPGNLWALARRIRQKSF